jgi:hypothetical protein
MSIPENLVTWEEEIRSITVQGQPRKKKSKTLSQKYLTQKCVSRVAQVLEHLPSKCESLCSNTSNKSTILKQLPLTFQTLYLKARL